MDARKVVLVVDDEQITRDVVAAMIESPELAVHTAGSGEEAMAKAAELRPDIVLLDLVLPGQDGFETCRELRSVSGRDIRIVILSALDDSATKADALAAGADAFLAKPYSARDLYAALEGGA